MIPRAVRLKLAILCSPILLFPKYYSFHSAQLQRLVRMFKILHVTIISNHQKQRANNNDADQTVHLHRLSCTFVVCMQFIQHFSRRGWVPLGGGGGGRTNQSVGHHLLSSITLFNGVSLAGQ